MIKFIINLILSLDKYLGIVYYYSWIYKHKNVYNFLCICWIINTLNIIFGVRVFLYKMPFSVYLFHTIGLIVIIIFQINKLVIHLSKNESKKRIVKEKNK